MSKELDASVAEKVMGWVHNGSCPEMLCRSDMDDWWTAPGDPKPTCGPCHNLPSHYSTEIETAWLVVEQMRRRGFHLELLSPNAWVEGKEWGVGFCKDDVDAEAIGDTAPEAICRAALEAVNK